MTITVFYVTCMKRSVWVYRCNRMSVKLRNCVYVRSAVSVQSLQSAQSLRADRGHRHPQVREMPLPFTQTVKKKVNWWTDPFDMVWHYYQLSIQGIGESKGHSSICPIPVVFSRTGPFLCTLDRRCAEWLGANALFNTWWERKIINIC